MPWPTWHSTLVAGAQFPYVVGKGVTVSGVHRLRLMTVAIFVLVTLIPANASGSTPATVTGRLTDAVTGSGLGGICVWALPAGPGAVEAAVRSDPAGFFTLQLEPGRYTLRATDDEQTYLEGSPCGPGDHVAAWYPGPAPADGFSVLPATTTVVDLALAVQATVSGTVTGPTGAPLAGIFVHTDGGAVTGATGAYRIKVTPGANTLVFEDEAGEHATTFRDVEVPEGGAVVVDVVMALGGRVSGRVVDAATGAALGSPFGPITVFLYGPDRTFATVVDPFTGNGTYTVGGLAAGDYRVRVDGGFHYLSVWYGGTGPDNAAVVKVIAGANATGVDVALRRGGYIAGSVLDAAGLRRPEPPLCATVFDESGAAVRTGYGDGPQGSFSIGGLETGTYLVRFADCMMDFDRYLPTWYGGVLDAASATPVPVVAGETTAGINGLAAPFQAFSPKAALALVEPDTGRWHVVDGDRAGRSFYYGIPGDLPLLGDWDCDGEATPGMYRPSNGFVYLRNSRTMGFADLDFWFGLAGDLPVAGDWDGDGCDTVGIYRPEEGRAYLRNSLTTGVADVAYFLGVPGDRPFAGDFDGDGDDEVAVSRPGSGTLAIRLTTTSGPADLTFAFGAPGDLVVAGDWDGDGVDTAAAVRPSTGEVWVADANATVVGRRVVVMAGGLIPAA